jgi:DNA-binding IclR family transcriptional regulator
MSKIKTTFIATPKDEPASVSKTVHSLGARHALDAPPLNKVNKVGKPSKASKAKTDIAAETPVIQVMDRMFSLLDVLATYRDPVSLKTIAAATKLHPSTAHRILNDLVIGRLVERPDAGSYQLGMRLLELGNLVKGRLDVRESAIGPMRELHRITHQPVNLSVRQGDEIVYIERAYSERSGMQVIRAVGGRAPLHLTSVGKLFLSVDDTQKVRAYASRTGLAGHTSNSITELVKLERELSKIRSYGVSRDDEELEMGVRCMAVPIRDDTGKLVAGLSISAPADRLDEAWLERLQATAQGISQTLGYRVAQER